MSDPRIPSPYGGPDRRGPADPFADVPSFEELLRGTGS